MSDLLQNPIFQDEVKAREWLRELGRLARPAHTDLAEFDFRYNNRFTLGMNDNDSAAELAKASAASALPIEDLTQSTFRFKANASCAGATGKNTQAHDQEHLGALI